MNQRRAQTRDLPALDERFDFGPGTPGERQTLRAVQYMVLDHATDTERSLKLWKKTGTPVDGDLRQLWLHEARQIQRIMSYAGASDVIVDVLEFVEDEHDFGVLLEHAGQTLADMSTRAHRQHWLRNLSAPRPRAILWRNVRRIAQALGIVHAQGLVHGRLSTSAIMTEGAEEPDFQLTGFEWSLWLSGEGYAAPMGRRGSSASSREPTPYSFEGDWGALGALVAECFGMTILPSGDLLSPEGSATPQLGRCERSIIRRLVAPRHTDSFDAASIIVAIDEAAAEASKGGSSKSGSLILCFAQSAMTALGDIVFDQTAGVIAADDQQGQLDWLRADIGGGMRLLTPREFDQATSRLRLVTTNMVLTVAGLQQGEGVPSWDVAVCTKAEPRTESLYLGDTSEIEVRHPIEVIGARYRATEARARLGPNALDWSGIARPPTQAAAKDRGSVVRQALTLIEVVGAVIEALEVYPVQILDVVTRGGRRYAILRAQPDNDRDRQARRFGLADTERSLRRLFEDDQREADSKWRLSHQSSLGAGRRDAVAASLHDVRDHLGRKAYWFELDDELREDGPWFLRVEHDAGTEKQIQRRMAAISALEDRVDLARVFADPWRVRRSGKDRLDEGQRADKRFQELDEPKQKALVGLWETMPTYLVVGPPGVGKTHLVTEVVRRRFDVDASSRLLLTAQGHDALDHLQQKVCEVLADAGRPDLIVVRTSTRGRPETPQGVRVTRSRLLRDLSESALMREAPAPLSNRVRDLAAMAEVPASNGSASEGAGAALDAAAALVLDAANVVITTANSGDVGRLVEAHEQFDWVIVEEAAKATGPELVGPLMLSGRRLMIGDHKQLPPFDADRLRKVLENTRARDRCYHVG